MSVTNLGKRPHTILRDILEGGYVNGEWVNEVRQKAVIMANIQPSTFSYRTQLLPSGDREKEAVSIFSNEWLHTSRTGDRIVSDVLVYRGALWEVVVSKPYGNFGRHCEAMAIKLDNSEYEEYISSGVMEEINQ